MTICKSVLFVARDKAKHEDIPVSFASDEQGDSDSLNPAASEAPQWYFRKIQRHA